MTYKRIDKACILEKIQQKFDISRIKIPEKEYVKWSMKRENGNVKMTGPTIDNPNERRMGMARRNRRFGRGSDWRTLHWRPIGAVRPAPATASSDQSSACVGATYAATGEMARSDWPDFVQKFVN